GILTVIVFTFTLVLQEFVYALTFISSVDKMTVSLGVPIALVRGDVYHWGALMAAALFTSIPLAIVYNVFIDRFIQGFTMGAPKATVEVDFFGAFNGSPPFGDEQPQMRGRVIYADLTNGRTTVRIGQDWSPSFAETPVSLTHIAFPLGYGASGKIGWRFPGVFLFQDLSATGAPLTVQLQLAAMKGSGPIAPGNARDTAAVIGTVESSGLPQLEAKLNDAKRSA